MNLAQHLNRIAFIFGLIACTFSLSAQQFNTLFHMRSVPQMTYTNPAFIPTSKVNFGLPGISSIYVSSSNSGFQYNDVIQRRFDDSLSLSVSNLISKLRDKNYLNTNVQVDLLSYGIRSGNTFFSFNVTEKIVSRFIYPKGLFQLVNEGNGNSLLGQRASLDGLGLDFMHYREYAAGFAWSFSERVAGGIKFKYLYGMENIWTKESDIGLTTDAETFDLVADGNIQIHTSGISSLLNDDEFDVSSYLFSKGNDGMAIDLGTEVTINDKISVSASVLDLGFIQWREDVETYQNNDIRFTFSGLDLSAIVTDGDTAAEVAIEELLDSLDNAFQLDTLTDVYRTPLISQIYLGGQYQLNDQNSLGVMSHIQVAKGSIRPSFVFSYQTRVKRWLTATANYAVYNRGYSNVGLGFAANAGPVQFYMVSDNVLVPLRPHKTKNVHFHTGMNLTFGRKVDKDGDGIFDNKDECPDVPGLEEFQGCPDSDGDKIPDPQDQCPLEKGPAEFQGCPDTDGDGIIDKNDKCWEVKGISKFNGCPDTDGDGIGDREDKCPELAGSPEFGGCPDADGDGIKDADDECPEQAGILAHNGCPDTDNDGIRDREDPCPTKPGPLASDGCPDSDGDGLFDQEDNCPEIPGSLANQGCPFPDLDGDGTFDKDDECPGIAGPRENKGCPYEDTDKDGILDREDKCPNTPGPLSNKGCPEVKEEEQEVINTAFNNLEFQNGKAILKLSSYASLEELGLLLISKPTWKLLVEGHTDNVGSEEANLELSRRRAEAVKSFLFERGVDKQKVIVKYYGESKPVADNATEEGRSLNRRVELELLFD